MKIVYVGDNRNRGNYGCRGTSTALSQLISRNNEIVGRVSGRYTNFDTGELYFKKGLSKEKYEKLSQRKYWEYERKLRHYYHRFTDRGGRFLLGKHDFVTLDFEQSIQNLINCLPANPNLKEFDLRQYDFDALVVNGEGSFIFATPAWKWRESIVEAMEMYWAKKLGKKVYYLNGMVSDDPHSQHNDETIMAMTPIFNSCDGVCVRENYSLDYMHKYFPDVQPQLFPDALFTWYDIVNDDHKVTNGRYYMSHSSECDEAYYEFDFTKPYALISGSSALIGVCHGDMELAIKAYSELTEKAKQRLGCNVFLIDVDEGDEFLHEVSKRTSTPMIAMDTPLIPAAKILANARVYISGRYHPAIMASLGGTPCVFMSSNSHKTASLQDLLQYEEVKEYNLLPDSAECDRIIDAAVQKMNQPGLRENIQTRAYELNLKAQGLAQVIK